MNDFNKSIKQNDKAGIKVLFAAIAALMVCLVCASVTYAEKASAEPTIADYERALDETAREYYDAIAAQSEAQANVNEAESTIAWCEEESDKCHGQIAQRAKSTYINGYMGPINLLLNCNNLHELLSAIELLTILNNKDTELIRQSRELKKQIQEQWDILKENLEEANAQAEIATTAYNNAQAALAAAEAAQHVDPTPGGGGGGGGYIDPTTGNAIADRALGEQGKPYVWGAVGPDGYDCSGLVSYAVSGAHIRLGTTTTFMGWPRLSEPVVGCVCTNSYHCGIYVGGGSMCHAPTFGQTVCCTGVFGDMVYCTQ